MKRHGDESVCWRHDGAKRLFDLGLILVPDVTEFNGQLAESAVSQPMLYVPRLASRPLIVWNLYKKPAIV